MNELQRSTHTKSSHQSEKCKNPHLSRSQKAENLSEIIQNSRNPTRVPPPLKRAKSLEKGCQRPSRLTKSSSGASDFTLYLISPRKLNQEEPLSKEVELPKSPRRKPQDESSRPANRDIITPQRFEKKAKRKRKKIEERKHHGGWLEQVAHKMFAFKKDRSITSSIEVFHFDLWFKSIEDCQHEELVLAFKPCDLTSEFSCDAFVGLINSIADVVENKLQEILFNQPLYCLKLLINTYPEGSCPAELADLCDSKAFPEFVEKLNAIVKSENENRSYILWSIGGEKTVEILNMYCDGGARTRVYEHAKQLERKQRRIKLFEKSIKTGRSRSSSLPSNSANRKQHVKKRHDHHKSRAGAAKEKEPDLNEKGISANADEKKVSLVKAIIAKRIKWLHRAANSGNKRLTISKLRKTEKSQWFSKLERSLMGTIIQIVCCEMKENQQESRNAKFFIDWVDFITQKAIDNVLNENILVSTPIYWLQTYLEGFKDPKDVPEGLRELCLAENLEEFMEILLKIPESVDLELIRAAIGGDEVIAAMQKWLHHEQKDGVRIKVLNFLSDMARMRQCTDKKELAFPDTLTIPVLANYLALDNWFRDANCIVEELIYNGELVVFQTKESKPYDKMTEEELEEDTRTTLRIKKENLNKLFQALIAPGYNYTDKIEEMLKQRNESCNFRILCLQGIEMHKVPVGLLSDFIRASKSNWLIKPGSGKYQCRFTRIVSAQEGSSSESKVLPSDAKGNVSQLIHAWESQEGLPLAAKLPVEEKKLVVSEEGESEEKVNIAEIKVEEEQKNITEIIDSYEMPSFDEKMHADKLDIEGVRVCVEKHYEIHCKNFVIGTFKLVMRYSVEGSQARVEECEIKELKYELCEEATQKVQML